MRAFSVCNVDHPNLEVLRHSAAKQGYDLEILGRDYGRDGTPWSHSAKLVILRDRLRRGNDVPDSEVFAFVDAFDTCFANPASETEAAFRGANCDLLFSTTAVCFPRSSRESCDRYPDGGAPAGPRPYLNSGMILGTAGAWRRLFRHYGDFVHAHGDDQEMMHAVYVDPRRPVSIRLDRDGACLANLVYFRPRRRPLEPDGRGGARLRETGTRPGIVSAPGMHVPKRFRAYHDFVREAYPELDVDGVADRHLDYLRTKRKKTHRRLYWIPLLAAALFAALAVSSGRRFEGGRR